MAEFLDKMGLSYFWDKINQLKQDKLVSGTNIKTVNNESLLGTGNISAGSSLDFYPVGSCYTTATNTNPSSWLGGTWTLINKRFAPAWITSGFTFNTTNTQNGAFVAILNGNTIEFRFIWQNKVAISDDTKVIGTFDKSAIGLTGTEHTSYHIGFADGLNAVGMFSVDLGSNNNLTSLDWVTKATSYPTTTGQNVDLSFVINVRKDYMVDSFCNEFVWKRTD